MSNLRDSLDAKRCGAGAPVPGIDNPPGQSAIAYRIGTQPSFFERMRRRLGEQALPDGPNQGRRPLADLDQEVDDPAVALADTWAVAADVLTFYQERIANEDYLRTATERRSVLELAGLAGYELGPGVAAGAFLAFTVETAPGSPASSVVPVGTQVVSIPGQDELPQTFETQERIVARAEWNALAPRLTEPQSLAGAGELYLAGVATGLAAGDLLLLVVETAAGEVEETVVARLLAVETDVERDHTRVRLESALGVTAGVERVRAFALRAKAACFGHNAPLYGSLPSEEFVKDDPFSSSDPANDWDQGRTIWTDSHGRSYSDGADGLPAVFLERRIDEVVAGGWVVFAGTTLGSDLEEPEPALEVFPVTGASTSTRADYALSAEVTGLVLAGLAADAADRTPFDLRATTAYVVSEALAFADKPITDPFPAPLRDAAGTRLTLDRRVEGLRPGQLLALSGQGLDGGDERRMVVLRAVDEEVAPGFTTLVFQQTVGEPLLRESLSLNANVTRATHGETIDEVLGSGDAAAAGQSFQLRRSPLTFDSAPVPRGAVSSLQVRVDGVLWQEVDTLHGQGSEAQVYTVEVDDEGRATVRFGDGVDGARLPAGSENVTATYRIGLGPDGEVAAGALSLLTTRPLGIAEVTNPLAASGAAGPDTVEQARRNAPVTVRTLGRIVSLADFEDFAFAFAGIGKVRAAPLGGIHLTVAGVGGAAVEPGSVLFESLFRAIEAVRLPGPPLRLASYEPLPFDVSAKLVVDSRFRSADVFERVRELLLTTYAFDRRELGQPLYASEIVTVIQSVAGVVAVDLDAVYPSSRTPALPARLDALRARLVGGEVRPAQLLSIHPDGISLGARTP